VLIDADGLFNGDRMAMLSDDARLYWPYFWCASSQALARIELNYRKIVGRAFHSFKNPPAEEQFWRLAREYRDCYLLFIYKENGIVWGQWDTSAKNLGKYTTAADRKMPNPPAALFAEWKQTYSLAKQAFHGGNSIDDSLFGNVLEKLEQFSETFHKDLPIGDGVGIGDSKDKTLAPEPGRVQAKPDLLPDLGLQIVKPRREPSQEEKLAAEYAPAIHKRHVNRKCSLKESAELLAKILRRHSKDKQFAVMERIDKNHQGQCASDDWTKEGGQFCPGLDKWLLPDKERYFIEPPSRAGPKVTEKIWSDIPKFEGYEKPIE
jgi:hypothetical protein